MKIDIVSPKGEPVNEEFMLFKYALEHDNDFEKLVWKLRGWFGVANHELETQPKELQAIYAQALNDKPQLHPVDDPNIPDDPDMADMYFTNNLEATYQIAVNEKWREDVLRLSTIELLGQYRLPLAWVEPVAKFILTSKIIMPETVEPIVLSVEGESLGQLAKKHGLKSSTKNNITKYYRKYDGVKITLTAKITGLDTLRSWVTKNWQEIKKLMDTMQLPEDTHQQVQLLKLQRRAYEIYNNNKSKYGSKGAAITARELAKEFSHKASEVGDVGEKHLEVDYVTIRNNVKTYKGYIKKYSKKIKV